MALSLATAFPFNAEGVVVSLSPNELDVSSRVVDVSDVNLTRRLLTARRSVATSYVVELTVGSDQSINFVSVIGSSVSGAATVELLPAQGNVALNGADTSLALSSELPSSHKLFGRTFSGVRRVRVSFPAVGVNGRLECALIVAGQLQAPQAQAQSIRTLFGRLRFERRPRGVQLPSAARGLARTVNVVWTNLSSAERDELRDLFRGTDLHSTVALLDDSQSDGLVFGFIDGTFQVTDRSFSDYSEARLRVQEMTPAA